MSKVARDLRPLFHSVDFGFLKWLLDARTCSECAECSGLLKSQSWCFAMGDDGSGSDGKEKEGAQRDSLDGGHGIQVIQLTANRRRGGGGGGYRFCS